MKFVTSLCVGFEFSEGEAERVIAAGNIASRCSVLAEIMACKCMVSGEPIFEFQMESFLKSYGQALVEKRTSELKMLQAPTVDV